MIFMEKNVIEIPNSVKLSSKSPKITGNNNKIVFGEDGRAKLSISIFGNNNQIIIGSQCRLMGNIVIKADNCILKIGDFTTALGVKIHFHESEIIQIGNDCMFSGNIQMNVSDVHSVIDLETQKRINRPKPIVIEDHVWIAQQVTIGKGVKIGTGSIISSHSKVTKDIPSHVMAAGYPAKVIKRNISWERKLLPFDEV